MSSPSTRPDGRYRDGAGRILGRTIADAGGYLAQQADVPAAALALQTQFDRLSGAAQVEVMQSMAEVLDSMFEHLSDDEVPQSGLSASERAALAAIGADDGARGDAAPLRRNMARNAAMNAAIQASARPLAEIARMLELSDGRLRQRLAERSLLGFKSGEKWLIPMFQFNGVREIPGLARVLKTIRRDAPLSLIASFLATPQPELADAEDNLLTPIDWLLAGGDAEAVADAAREI